MQTRRGLATFVLSRWKSWVPPLVVTLLVFGALLLFVKGSKLAFFDYEIF